MKAFLIFGLLAYAGALPQVITPREDPPKITPRAGTCAKIPSWMKSTFTDRIVGGKKANGPIPWQVSIQLRKGIWKHFCGGTILDANTILSAAHCFASKNGEPLPIAHKVIVAGARDFEKQEATQVIAISKLIWTTGNDKFDTFDMANDIVIVKLAKSLTFNANVQPACLPAADFFPDKKPAVVSGWGMLKWDGSEQQAEDSSLVPLVLQYVDAPLINNAECTQKSKYKEMYAFMEKIADNQLCAGYIDDAGKDSCKGDSGGPLVLPLSSTDDTAVVVGVVSFGPEGCALKGFPGIYARVTKFLPWIKANMGGSSSPPSPPPPPPVNGGTMGTDGGILGVN